MDLEAAITAARSPAWEERAAAARILAEVDDSRVSGFLDVLLDDDDLAVIQAAAESLLQRADVSSVSRFTKAYAAADDQVGDHLNDVLGTAMVSQPRIIASLRTLAEAGDPGAGQALDWLGLSASGDAP